MRRQLLGWLRLDLVRLLLLALPALLVDRVLQRRSNPLWQDPGPELLLLVPLAVLSGALWFWARRDNPRTLGAGFLVFFPIFCLLLAVATSSDLLTGKRELIGTYGDDEPPRHFGLNFLGDWHYRLARPTPPADDLLVLTLPFQRNETRGELRRRFAALIAQGTRHGVRAMAFDYYLETATPIDPLLRRTIAAAEDAHMPVLFGYRRVRQGDQWLRQRPADDLVPLVAENRLGDLGGYREADLLVRMVHLQLEDGVGLSSRLAELMLGGPPPPVDGRLLRFSRPVGGIPVMPFEELDWGRLRGRYLWVGTASESDRVETPWGPAQGVEVHAWATQTLRSGTAIQRMPKAWSFPILFVLCYLLALTHARGGGPRRLAKVAALLTLTVVATASLAMRGWLLWIDIAYPLAAIALMTAGLLILDRQRRRPLQVLRDPGDFERAVADTAQPTEPTNALTQPATAQSFDIFLSHSSRDKAMVVALAKALEQRRLRPWLDIWELPPGRPWQEALEEVIQTVRSSAVTIGATGLGPWEIPEMRACLSEVVRRGLPVIPVLLPGAPPEPHLPLFLTQFTWVDLRSGIDPAGIDRLVWGITGEKPTPDPAVSPPAPGAR